jgi:tyrosine-protein kinase Etk/Wzc
MDTSIGTIEDVEDILKLPALGVIPYLKVKGEKEFFWQKILPMQYKGRDKVGHLRKQLIINYSLRSSEMEAYRILRTNIQNELLKGERGKVFLFTSATPEEGKSITISNLAIIFAQEGYKTLLIDCDLRRSVTHEIFGLKNREPGLSDIIRGAAIFENSVRKIADVMMGELGFDAAIKAPGLDNLSILTSGTIPAIPAEILSLSQTFELLQKLKQGFDIIFLDCAPVLAVADPLILGPKVDGVILIYRVGKTTRRVVLRAKTQLQDVNAQVKGVVLNNISPDVELYYGYYYRYKYYRKYYGEEQKKGA